MSKKSNPLFIREIVLRSLMKAARLPLPFIPIANLILTDQENQTETAHKKNPRPC